MSRWLLLCVADLHTNSTLGLCNPDATLPEGQPVSLSRAQQWLWQCWLDVLADVLNEFRAGDQIGGVMVGDGPDMNRKTSQLHTTDPSGAISLFVETIRPLRELCEDGFWIVRGTENHTGDAGNLEETAAQLLDTTHYPADSKRASTWLLRLLLSGVRVDLAHHGPAGRLPWTGPNGLGRAAYEIVDEYVRAGEPVPQVAVQAHNHKFYDSHESFPVRVLGLPCWQLQTSYGYRVSPRRTTDIGAVLLVCEDGRVTVRPRLFRPAMEQPWQNASN